MCAALAVQTLDDSEGDGGRVVVKSPGGAIRVEVSSTTGDVNVYYDGSPEPLVGVPPLTRAEAVLENPALAWTKT